MPVRRRIPSRRFGYAQRSRVVRRKSFHHRSVRSSAASAIALTTFSNNWSFTATSRRKLARNSHIPHRDIFGEAFLGAAPPDLRQSHAIHPERRKRFTHGVDLERLDNRDVNKFHFAPKKPAAHRFDILRVQFVVMGNADERSNSRGHQSGAGPLEMTALRSSDPAIHGYCIVAVAEPYAQHRMDQIMIARFRVPGFWTSIRLARMPAPTAFFAVQLERKRIQCWFFVMPQTRRRSQIRTVSRTLARANSHTPFDVFMSRRPAALNFLIPGKDHLRLPDCLLS